MQTLTSPFVPSAQESITEDIQPDREERDGEEVHVRVPHSEFNRVIRPGNDCGGDELGFGEEFRQSAFQSSKRKLLKEIPIQTHH